MICELEFISFYNKNFLTARFNNQCIYRCLLVTILKQFPPPREIQRCSKVRMRTVSWSHLLQQCATFPWLKITSKWRSQSSKCSKCRWILQARISRIQKRRILNGRKTTIKQFPKNSQPPFRMRMLIRTQIGKTSKLRPAKTTASHARAANNITLSLCMMTMPYMISWETHLLKISAFQNGEIVGKDN